MIECKTLKEAQAVKRVVRCHREADDRWLAYQEGDELPPPPPEPTTEELNAQACKEAKQLLDANDSRSKVHKVILEWALGLENWKRSMQVPPEKPLTKAQFWAAIKNRIDAE